MKLIKEFDGIDLAVSKVLRSSLWPTPGTLYDERGELVELRASAADYIAERANLGNEKTALLLSLLDQPRWKPFTNIFATSDDNDDTTNLCFTNKDQTVIYSFLTMGLEAETEALGELFTMLDDKQIEFVLAQSDSGRSDLVTFLAVDASPFNQESPDQEPIEMVYMYTPETQWLSVVGHYKKQDAAIGACLIYNNHVSKRLKKDPQFTMDAIDPNFVLQKLEFDLPEEVRELADIRPSLQEVIMSLRVIQMSKNLQMDPSDFIGIFIERYSTSRKEITRVISTILAVIDVYQFYYADDSLRKDKELLGDPLKDAKPHLYFADELRLPTLFSYVDEFVTAEYDFIKKQMNDSEREDPIELDYFMSLLKHQEKRIKQPREKYDEVKIPTFYQED